MHIINIWKYIALDTLEIYIWKMHWKYNEIYIGNIHLENALEMEIYIGNIHLENALEIYIGKMHWKNACIGKNGNIHWKNALEICIGNIHLENALEVHRKPVVVTPGGRLVR